MTLSATPQPAITALIKAAHRIAPLISDNEAISRPVINQAMSEAFGTSSAEGTWTQRDSFQMLEVATILALREMSFPADTVAAIEFLTQLEARLPTQTVRSEEQVALQHFSTPLALSWIMGHLAAIEAHDVVLEPSAGTGMLAQWLGAGKGRYLNEIDPLRAETLAALFPQATVTSFDAARIASHTTNRPSVIVMNPPFARSASGHADSDAAARHLLSALAALRPGGRLVAVMPDGFSNHGRGRETFMRVLQGSHVCLHLRVEGAFTKHGASIPIRLLVVDKVPGSLETSVINRNSLRDIPPHITQAPARCAEVLTEVTRTVAPKPATSGGLFKAFSAPRTVARPVVRSDAGGMEAMDLPYTLREDIAEIGQDVGIYTDFRPQRLVFPIGSAHPSPLVESAAMASVALPAPSVIPKLPRKVIEQGLLSTAQLETLVHVLDATSQDLPGRYIVPEKGVELRPHAEGDIYRRGFFLGDGTGAGKGRQLAAILMDQWLRGNRRHIWISDSSALILSRLCESVLARAPPVQWGGYSRRMDITRPIT
ncbi:strawberry notch-like NTP hydrolase domain-containing protein, partial [Novosphingobium sp. SCN 63-17]